jgi:hypothetical protein
MTADEDKILADYDEAVRLKEVARKSVDNIQFYLKAAEHLHGAAELSAKLAEVGHDVDRTILHKAFSSYYFYEEHDCLSGYYYEKRDTEAANEHTRLSKNFIDMAVSTIKDIPPEVSLQVRKSLLGFLPDWEYRQRTVETKELANNARAAWDRERFIEALDIYRRMASVQRQIVDNLPESLDPKHKRIAVGNYIGFMANASSAMAQLMLKRAESGDADAPLQLPSDIVAKILGHTLDAYALGETAFQHNPEWEQYREVALNCRRNIQNVLKLNPSLWGQLYLAFEDNPEFLRIMKMTDLNKFKEAESARHLRENKLLKLWGVGSFWLFVLFSIAALVLFIQSYNLAWWRFALVIAAIEVVLVLIGAFTLRTVGDLSEKNFLELMRMAFKYQFGFFRLYKKGSD